MVCLVGMLVMLLVCEGVYVQVCLCLGEICCVYIECCVMIGEVGNEEYSLCQIGKVGVNCWCGICLMVCGVVMNLVDYLYGGGEGKMVVGCDLVSLWGMLVKGYCICSNKCMMMMIVQCCYKC